MEENIKDIFKEAFIEEAPADLSKNVLNKLNEEKSYGSLISKKYWLILLFVIVVVGIVVLIIPKQGEFEIPYFDIQTFSFIAVVLTAVVLLKLIQTLLDNKYFTQNFN